LPLFRGFGGDLLERALQGFVIGIGADFLGGFDKSFRLLWIIGLWRGLAWHGLFAFPKRQFKLSQIIAPAPMALAVSLVSFVFCVPLNELFRR
jgi:hypothetical protein